MAVVVGSRFQYAALLALLIVLAVGAYYFVRSIVVLVLFSSIVGSHNIVEDSAKNGRGDVASSTSEGSGRWQDPERTIIRLQRTDHWFSTTLVETKSFGVHEHLEWKNENELDVTLDFGCMTHMTHPVDKVGAIRVSYHFSDGNRELAKGCPG